MMTGRGGGLLGWDAVGVRVSGGENGAPRTREAAMCGRGWKSAWGPRGAVGAASAGDHREGVRRPSAADSSVVYEHPVPEGASRASTAEYIGSYHYPSDLNRQTRE